jgi:hypothetical protein
MPAKRVKHFRPYGFVVTLVFVKLVLFHLQQKPCPFDNVFSSNGIRALAYADTLAVSTLKAFKAHIQANNTMEQVWYQWMRISSKPCRFAGVRLD